MAESSPARGTWVEIYAKSPSYICRKSRLPHGGRGLKLVNGEKRVLRRTVVSRTGDVG